MINGGAVSWKAKQQNCIAHSFAEGEFMAASKASLEAIWLRRLLKSCGAPQPRATTLYEDNRACQLLSPERTAALTRDSATWDSCS